MLDSPTKLSQLSQRDLLKQPTNQNRLLWKANRKFQNKMNRLNAKQSIVQPIVSNQCGLCRKTNDQHLLALCDSCNLHYHLGCLDPPLTRMPKKSRFGGWQCSECTEKEDVYPEANSFVVDIDENSADGRRLRESRKVPNKFVPDENSETPMSLPKKRGRPLGSSSKKKQKPKKPRIEQLIVNEDGSQQVDSDRRTPIPPIKISTLKKNLVKKEPVTEECIKCKQMCDVKDLVQ